MPPGANVGPASHEKRTQALPESDPAQFTRKTMGELLNGTQKGTENKLMTDEAMMNTVCNDLANGTTKAILEGGGA